MSVEPTEDRDDKVFIEWARLSGKDVEEIRREIEKNITPAMKEFLKKISETEEFEPIDRYV